MRKFILVLLALLMCVFCFGCTAQPQVTDAETGEGTVQTDPYESVGDPSATPVFVFLVTVSGVIAVSAGAVLIRDAKRKSE